ncbi:hypothetical protein [Candidatus Poriferisocius sp.]|uniref:hypothetical protein n=1 Tax=Candidatus Poriferisocius sp. TaxID=3101276 RepID=UPI003B019F88
MLAETAAVADRNQRWASSPLIPSWVDVSTVGLDQIFTRPELAARCYADLTTRMRADHAPVDDYQFVEPGAGAGAFYDLLPPDRRTGLDILPRRDDFERGDFLTWHPATMGRHAVIGNPPFGYRAWLALAFVNHAATFADYAGLILPMAFQSEGKGSPKHRVTGMRLIHSEPLPPDSFVHADGRDVKINALWQVWQRGVNNRPPAQRCDEWIDLFTVDQRKERLCGQERMAEADWFLQRTFYHEPPKPVRAFSLVRYVCGYGIVIHKAKRAVSEALQRTDWRHYSNLAAHNCRHISMYHIRQAVIDAGFVNG